MRLFKQTPEDYYNAPYAEFPALIRGTVFVVMAILWAFSKLMWRWKVEDADLLFERQEGRGSVVICNHTSMAELLAVETALFFGGRRIRPIFKSEFAKSKIVRWAFSRVGGIPVERGTADMKCLRAAQHALQRGEDVLIFPEGTRIRSREIKPEVHGTIRCAHGLMPIPVPAVVNLCQACNIALTPAPVAGELVTPTGAAIVTALRTSDQLPSRYHIEAVGYGAGKRPYEGCSGTLRCLLVHVDA